MVTEKRKEYNRKYGKTKKSKDRQKIWRENNREIINKKNKIFREKPEVKNKNRLYFKKRTLIVNLKKKKIDIIIKIILLITLLNFLGITYLILK